MTKNVIFSVLGILFSIGVWSQSDNTTMQVEESTDKYKVETNHFFDNWIFGAGAGGQIYFGDHDRQQTIGKLVTPTFNVYLGKWFTPGIGVRAGFTGSSMKGLTQTNKDLTHSTGKVFDISRNLYYQEFDYYHLNADVMLNLTNIFLGYKEKRFYNLTTYGGLGWIMSTDKPREDELTAVGGFLNSFRLGSALDLTLDLRAIMINDRFDHEIGDANVDGVFSASIGLVYKFNKRNWGRSSAKQVAVPTYDESELNALRQKLDEASRNNASLSQQLANANSQVKTDLKVEKVTTAAPIFVVFPINQSVVTGDARVNLGFFAQVIKSGDSKVVYTITGYADKGTGTKERNEILSKERAQAVYDVLVNEFQVSPSQLKIAYEGGVGNMFYDDPRLSRAVITKAK